MPTLNQYKKMLGSHTNGEARKIESDDIIEFTWDEDIQSKTAYFYDYYLDDEPLKYKNLNPIKNKRKIPVPIKFMTNSYNSDNKDQVSYHIMFKPSFDWETMKEFQFYKERFIEKYDAEFPIGLYCEIPDEKGIYRKWLVTEPANWLDNQFQSFSVLPCDNIYRWVYEGKIYQMCGVGRSQNS